MNGAGVVIPDELTPSWLTARLRESGALRSGTVDEVGAERIGTGRLGTTYRLTPTYDGAPADAPATVVAKLPTTDAGGRAWAASIDCYRREVAFYTDVAADLEVRAPRCHHAWVSDDGTDFCLLLEDLTPALALSQADGCDLDQARAALDQAAALHAGSWDEPRLRDLTWLAGGMDMWRAMSASMPDGQLTFRERYADLLDDATVAVATGFAEGAAAVWAETVAEPRCVWHCDFRLDNLLFDARGGLDPVAVVDWQSVVLGHGTVDASYFIGAGLTVEQRREHEEDLVRGYHDALLERGVRGYSWSQCWEEYRRNAVAGFVVAVCASIEIERSPAADAMFMAMASRHAAHIADHRSFALLGD